MSSPQSIYLWVFQSCSVVHYVIDKTRAAEVIIAELAGVDQGVISCDRYSGYKRFARLNPGVVLAFCWAHQRRDFLDLANSYPDSAEWALQWVDTIVNSPLTSPIFGPAGSEPNTIRTTT